MIGTRSVLVVEPEGDDRGGLTAELRQSGLLVECVGDAARAMAGIASNHHAIILIDPATPNLTAEGVTEAVRAARLRPVVLVVIDDVASVPRGFGADAIHGYVRRGAEGELAELIHDTLAVLRESAAGSQAVRGDSRQSDRASPR
jgi:DNA-binding response OmpR family regulator